MSTSPILSKATGEVKDSPSASQPDYVRIFNTFGVSFRSNGSGNNLSADACPWCDGDRFFLNKSTGQYDCKKCQTKGNITTYLTWQHKQFLDATREKDYSSLGGLRGIPPQTLRRHELAYAQPLGCWLIPFRNGKGNIANIMRFYPTPSKPNKLMLPGLPTSIYGFNKLVNGDKNKLVLLCEGPFDAIALDYNLGNNRDKYVIVAILGSFKEEWVEHFRGRKVRCFFDLAQRAA